MSSSEEQTPDLASILRTLAALAPQNQQAQAEAPPQLQNVEQAPGGAKSYQPEIQNYQPPAHAWPRHEEAQLQRSTTPPGLPKNHVDPATIIDWSNGLRCVMKVVGKNENIVEEIRRMIRVQKEHEEQWFRGREALIQKQKARKEGQKKLDEVLRAVGGTVAVGTSNTSTEELARELETFDMKVYKAQMQMTREMSNKLRSLGVPFFGTRSDLVRSAGKKGPELHTESTKDGKVMIDEAELVKLQRKMLTMLEELCND